MSDEQQPNLQWGPLEQKPRGRGRVWVIVGLVVAALVIVGVLLFFLLPRGESRVPDATAMPSASATATPTPSPGLSTSPLPTMTAITTPPPAADPTVETFRTQVEDWLSDGDRGLDLAAQVGGQDAVSVIDSLQLDAQRLSDAQPPSSIDGTWRDAVEIYSTALGDLREAASGGKAIESAVSSARTALANLKTVVGM